MLLCYSIVPLCCYAVVPLCCGRATVLLHHCAAMLAVPTRTVESYTKCYVVVLDGITGHYYHYVGIGIAELLRAVQPNALPLVLR